MGAMQAFQQFENHFAGPEIQVAGGFIGEQHRRLPTSARASTTRCCSPPDNSPARCDARAPRPTSSNLASDSGTRLRHATIPESAAASSHSPAPKTQAGGSESAKRTQFPGFGSPTVPNQRARKCLTARSISYRSKACPDRPASAAAWTCPRPIRPPAPASPRVPRPDSARKHYQLGIPRAVFLAQFARPNVALFHSPALLPSTSYDSILDRQQR